MSRKNGSFSQMTCQLHHITTSYRKCTRKSPRNKIHWKKRITFEHFKKITKNWVLPVGTTKYVPEKARFISDYFLSLSLSLPCSHLLTSPLPPLLTPHTYILSLCTTAECPPRTAGGGLPSAGEISWKVPDANGAKKGETEDEWEERREREKREERVSEWGGEERAERRGESELGRRDKQAYQSHTSTNLLLALHLLIHLFTEKKIHGTLYSQRNCNKFFFLFVLKSL